MKSIMPVVSDLWFRLRRLALRCTAAELVIRCGPLFSTSTMGHNIQSRRAKASFLCNSETMHAHVVAHVVATFGSAFKPGGIGREPGMVCGTNSHELDVGGLVRVPPRRDF